MNQKIKKYILECKFDPAFFGLEDPPTDIVIKKTPKQERLHNEACEFARITTLDYIASLDQPIEEPKEDLFIMSVVNLSLIHGYTYYINTHIASIK